MSFYFTILSPVSTPIFSVSVGTSKTGGDGTHRFTATQLAHAPFIVHASLDVLDELQWGSGAMYLKTVDRHHSAYVSAFLTGSNVKLMLLSQALTEQGRAERGEKGEKGERMDRTTRAFVNYNPTGAEAEESVKKFFLDVYDVWLKTVMNPFYHPNAEITSPVFRQRVLAAAKKHL